MTDKPIYRWDLRRAAKDRRQRVTGSISTHDLVILAVIMAMLVLVLRIIMIYGSVLGMEIGPFSPHNSLLVFESLPYANATAVTDSFHELKFISCALFVYWVLASWKSFVSRSVSLSTKFFKATIGMMIIFLLAASFFPDHAIYLANIWFDPSFSPRMKS